MRKSIATVSLSGTLPEKLAAIAQARFDGVEIFENDLVTSPCPPERIRGQAADLGLAIELYQPFRDFEAMPPEALRGQPRPGASASSTLMERAGRGHHAGLLQRLPATRSATTRWPPQHLHALAERAAARGMRIAYEALAWGRHVNDYQHSWEIVRARRPPGARRVPRQLPHPVPRLRPGGDPRHPGREDLLPAAGRRAGAGHGRAAVVPAPPLLPRPGRLRPDRLRGARAGRRLRRPALAGGLQRHLPAGRAGIHGAWTRCARCSTWRNRSGAAADGRGPGRGAPAERGAGQRAGRGRLSGARCSRRLPRRLAAHRPASGAQPAPPWSGLAFAEIAAAAADAPALADTLRALGFTRAGVHRTKNAVAVAARRGAPRPEHRPGRGRRSGRIPARPAADRAGLRTTDSAALADRAEQYLAPVLPRGGAGERPICPRSGRPPGRRCCSASDDEWLGDFTAVRPARTRRPPRAA